jgi:hypothetical protein
MPKEDKSHIISAKPKSAKPSFRMASLTAALDTLHNDDDEHRATLQVIMTSLSKGTPMYNQLRSFTNEDKHAVVEAFMEAPPGRKKIAALTKITEIAGRRGGARRRTRRRSKKTRRSKVRSRK